MDSSLDRITNWEDLAEAAAYWPTGLALACNVSLRQLERFMLKTFGMTPQHWLHELRMRRAIELLRKEIAVKETAFLLSYKDPAHFTHAFKAYFGIAPSQMRDGNIPISFSARMSRFDKSIGFTSLRRDGGMAVVKNEVW